MRYQSYVYVFDVEAGLSTLDCSNVANALRDLLELAKQAGIDPAHPTMKAATAELEKLATSIGLQPSGKC
jgi:phage terminase small subunit